MTLGTNGLKIGAGVGMGVVFGSRILSVYRNLSHPKERSQFFNYAPLGFTYTEAAGLFALISLLIIAYFSILFVFTACLSSSDQFLLFTFADSSVLLVPFLKYTNADLQKKSILKQNKGKSGIYL
jgi:F0F1-type ATP synthase membrane subunit c/vacuolar-type H+-ATPase subunit K